MDKSAVDLLIEETSTSTVKIGGKDFVVGKILAITYLKLAKFLARIAKSYAKQMIEFVSGESDIADIIKFLEIIEQQDLSELINILLRTDSVDINIITGEELIDFVEVLVKHNDIPALLKKVQGAIQGIQNRLLEMTTKP